MIILECFEIPDSDNPKPVRRSLPSALPNLICIDSAVTYSSEWQYDPYGGKSSFCHVGVLYDVQKTSFVGFHSPRNLEVYVNFAQYLMVKKGSDASDLELYLVAGTDYSTQQHFTKIHKNTGHFVPFHLFPSYKSILGISTVGRNWVRFFSGTGQDNSPHDN